MPENKVKLIADLTICAEHRYLLVKYRDSNKYDHQKGWFLPDDIVEHGEHPEDGGKRILLEQLGVNDGSELKLHHIESFTGNDKSWHLVFHFLLYLENMHVINPSDEISECAWHLPDALPDEKEIAHHGWAKFTIQNIADSPI